MHIDSEINKNWQNELKKQNATIIKQNQSHKRKEIEVRVWLLIVFQIR